MGRPPCCDKSNVKRGLWTPEEDARILAHVSNHGIGNWTLLPKKAGLNRCGKSCRLRWTNYLRPDLKHESFTPQEEDVIINLHKLIGSRWSLIAKHLPGRTDNDVKNYWNTKLRKKLTKMGIDPITHKPISQVLYDYGSINTLPNPNNNPPEDFMGSFDKNLLSKIQHSSIPNEFQHNLVVQDNNLSWDIFQPNFFTATDQVTSPCSSSSSTVAVSQQSSSFQCQTTPTNSPFSWSEFLLTDPAVSFHENSHQQPEEKLPGMLPRSSTMADKHNDGTNLNLTTTNGVQDLGGFIYDQSSYAMNQANIITDASSAGSSFVDGILDMDCEIRSQFPQLLDASFDY